MMRSHRGSQQSSVNVPKVEFVFCL